MRTLLHCGALAALAAAVVGSCSLQAAGSITVTPPHESAALGTTRIYSATVSGLASNLLTWSVSPAGVGSIVNGVYKTPAAGSIMVPTTVTIVATSQSDPAVSGTASLTLLNQGPALSWVSPNSFPVGNVTLSIAGSGFETGAKAYFITRALPTTFVDATHLTVTTSFTAARTGFIMVKNPASTFSNTVPITITAGSGGGGGGGSLVVAPSAAVVAQGGTQQFTATSNGSPASVTWSVTGGATNGTVSAAGLYTAPAQIPNPAVVTVTATGASNTTASAQVTIVSNAAPAITSVTPNPVPLGIVTLTVAGSGFAAGSQIAFAGQALPTQFVNGQLQAAAFAGQGGSANVTVANGPVVSQPFAVQVGIQNALVTPGAARRFLEQAAFGPTPADAAHVQTVGFQGWLNEQFAMPKVSNYQGLGSQSGDSTRFLTNAVTNADQLRQKVAFAYSQIWVTSIVKNIWNTTTNPYEEMLMTDAFANFRQILNDVTRAPAMGQFLDMANNGKGNAAGTIQPNENYAREILQLFSIGTLQLNPDGTPVMVNGATVPNYTQNTITEFARVFTGWAYAPNSPSGAVQWNQYINPNAPMQPYPAEHDTNPKTLLAGVLPPGKTTLPGGQSTQADLNDALDNIFYHPNAGPFLSKQLIQHLVKSNPSAGYVFRVAQAFNDNGHGVRGDMQAVIAAILLDQEARANDVGGLDQPTDGHLQEPALFVAGVVRAFGGIMNDQNYFSWDMHNMAQEIYDAASVFNYYSPGYRVPGVGIGGPEFQIYSSYTSVYRANLITGLFGQYSNPVQTSGPGTTVDLTPFVSLASTPATLVDALDLTLTHGQMPAAMKADIVSAVTAESGGSLRRAQTGAVLIINSGYYGVWH